jgi:hypothetical protein
VAYVLVWTRTAREQYDELRADAQRSLDARSRQRARKPGRAEGLYKQVHACLQKLSANPRHPGLQTHKFHSLEHPYDPRQPVFEAYVQNRTAGAYRLFWCYGPEAGDITVLAITPHP